MIRRARPDDLDAIVRVHIESFGAAHGAHVDPAELEAKMTPEANAAAWRPVVEAPQAGTMLEVAEADGEVVGLCGAGPSRDRDGKGVGELYALYVLPDRWGGGTGTALEASARAHLRDQGFTEATLCALAANARARRFYERRGWRTDGATGEMMGAATVRYRTRL